MDILVARFGYRYVSIYTVDGPLMRLGAQRGYTTVIESFDGSIGVVGRAKDLIARLEPLVAAGARHLSFGPPLGPDPLRAVELLGQEVLPHFRD